MKALAESINAKLEMWLRRQVAGVEVEGRGRVLRFVLRHIRGSSTAGDIELIDVPKKNPSNIDNWIREAAMVIDMAAQGHADGLGGMQRYTIFAYYKDSTTTVEFTMRKHGITNDDDESALGELDSEGPGLRGAMSQQMRHNEATMKLFIMGNSTTLQSLITENQRLSQRCADLEQQRDDFLAKKEQLESQAHTREMEMVAFVHKEERNKELWGKALMLLGPVANKIVGKKIIAEEGGSIQDQMLSDFVASLSSEQMGDIQKVLGEEQLVVLAEIFNNAKSKQNGHQKPA